MHHQMTEPCRLCLSCLTCLGLPCCLEQCVGTFAGEEDNFNPYYTECFDEDNMLCFSLV